MTSSDKMAACLLSSDEGDGISKISSVLEGKIKDLLADVNSANCLDTSKTVCSSYTKAALLDFRRKLFTIASKIEAEKEKGGANQKDAIGFDKDECFPKESYPSLANRKAKPPVVDDVIALAQYIKHPKGGFPRDVLKAKSSGKSKLPDQEDRNANRSDADSASNYSSSEQEEECSNEKGSKNQEIQKHFERFVIKEVGGDAPDSSESNIPITVTSLRDTSTSTGASPKLVSSYAQTDIPYPGLSIAELKEWEAANEYLDDDMSRKRSVFERDSSKDSDKGKVRENALDEVRRKCDRAEKRMDKMEHEHYKEMSILRLEHSIIKDELRVISKRDDNQKVSHAKGGENGPKNDQQRRIVQSRRAQSGIGDTASWETDESTMMTLTQNSQGEQFMTRITPAHAVLNTTAAKPQKKNATISALSPKRTDRVRDSKMSKTNGRESERFSHDDRSHDGDDAGNCRRCESIMAKNGAPSSNTRSKSDNRSMPRTSGNTSDDCGDITDNDESANDSSDGVSDDLVAKRRKTDDIIVLPDTPPGQHTQERGKPLPSTSGVGNISDRGGDGTKPRKEKYSKIVTRNGWTTPTGANKSPQKAGKKAIPMIAGILDNDTKEYFVLGLSVKNFRTHSDLEESVAAYCAERKVETSYQRVITLKNTKKTVGCKITIKSDDIDKIYEKDFWPKGIKIREWFDKKPTDKDRYFASSEESDDSKSK